MADLTREAAEELLRQVLLPKGTMVQFRVKATWANEGREGEIDSIVRAPDAIEALRQAWITEDPDQLRNVTIEWLTPEECVVNREDTEPNEEAPCLVCGGEGHITPMQSGGGYGVCDPVPCSACAGLKQ